MKKRLGNPKFLQFGKLKNKKGLSLIVTLLMIILLIFVAIGIVWFVIKNFISEGAGGISLGRFTLDLEIEKVSVDANNLLVNVKRNSGGGDFVGIKFIGYSETASESVETNLTLEELEKTSFIFQLTDLNVADIKEVSIAPIYESDSGKTSIGNVIDTFTIGSGGLDEEEPDPETCEPIENPCGTSVCGNIANGTCADVTCGTCALGECINGVCVLEGCVPETSEETCGTWVCGDRINNCGEEVGCGICGGTDSCIEGVCIVETSINSGVVGLIWPPGVAIYFDSADLPTFGVDYSYYYVKFPGSAETGCLLIADYILPILPEVYDKTHIQFNFPSNIQPGDNYEIWQTQDGCLGI